jgi:hypothetical protein
MVTAKSFATAQTTTFRGYRSRKEQYRRVRGGLEEEEEEEEGRRSKRRRRRERIKEST